MSVFLSFVKKLSIYWRRVCFIGPLMSICHATKSKRDNMHREAETVELRVGKFGTGNDLQPFHRIHPLYILLLS